MFLWIQILCSVFSVIMMCMLIYQGVFFLFSFGKPKKREEYDPENRFALVISARNEEAVIGFLLDSLRGQDYPDNLYDIFVIADNCTDETAGICAQKGAKVYVREDLTRIGKGYALGWFFERFLKDCAGKYDAVGIFDADNLVDTNFLRVMNNHLCAGEKAVMGYLDSKNPHDSWVSGSMSLGFWSMMRLHDLPRMRLGLSAMAAGTGYIFRTELIKNGWESTTMGEDTQFTMLINARGNRVALANDAIIYNEEPVKFGVSVRQRRRWSVAAYQNLAACFKPLVKALFTKNWLMALDGLIYLFFMPFMAVNTIVQTAGMFFRPVSQWGGMLLSLPGLFLMGLLVGVVQGLFVLISEKKLCKSTLKNLVFYPVFMLISSLIFVWALFSWKLGWKTVHHKRSMTLEEVNELKRVNQFGAPRRKKPIAAKNGEQ